MSSTCEPELLVALCHRIQLDYPVPYDSRRDTLSPTFQGDFEHDDLSSYDWASISESIASLCVFESKGQVIALAVDRDLTAKQTEILLAENDEVHDKTYEFIQNRFAVEHPSVKRIHDTVYNHILDRLKGRASKYYKKMGKEIKKKYPDYKPEEVAAPSDMEGFDELHSFIYTLYKITQEGSVDKEPWNKFRGKPDEGLEAEKIEGLVQRYWKKIVNVKRSIGILLNNVKNPLFVKYLEREVKVNRLGQPAAALNIPPQDSVATFFNADGALHALHITGQCSIDKIKEITKKLSNPKPLYKNLPVHCEIKILDFLAQNSDRFKSIDYVGVTKLACAGCHLYFEAFAKVVRRVRKKGQHGKFYFPWGLPDWSGVHKEDGRRLRHEILSLAIKEWNQRAQYGEGPEQVAGEEGTSTRSQRGASESTVGSFFVVSDDVEEVLRTAY
ncbi:unnamed protein product [Cyclocybe aegerita]|uniref:Uncharacterized protein n=1 Tax=Cyclocybe aegerita TaxID=1973307 RepID=A0A8S0WYW8_CYCAE|nr:unnamed protein product [Cyclocybe aegerita]